jgi:hypothetical protein
MRASRQRGRRGGPAAPLTLLLVVRIIRLGAPFDWAVRSTGRLGEPFDLFDLADRWTKVHAPTSKPRSRYWGKHIMKLVR